MKIKWLFFLIFIIVLSSCSSKSDESKVKTTLSDTLKRYEITICDNSNLETKKCLLVKSFSLDNEKILLLSNKEVGVSEYVGYDSKRFLLLPKNENILSAYNALAYGVYKYTKEQKNIFMKRKVDKNFLNEIKSYDDAKNFLKNRFKLNGTKVQEEAIFEILSKNIEKLSILNLEANEAYKIALYAFVEKILENLKEGEIRDLSKLRVIRKDDKIFITFAKNSNLIASKLTLSNFDISNITVQIKSPINILYRNYQCGDNQVKHLYLFGNNDNFYTGNIENTYYNSPYLRPYDIELANLYQFKEKLSTFSSNIVNGDFYIGLKYRLGGTINGTYSIYPINSNIAISGNTEDITNQNNNWENTQFNNIYKKDLSLMVDSNGESMLDKIVNGYSAFDILFNKKANIDFIALITCEEKKIDFDNIDYKCKDPQGSLITITGGNADNFAFPLDNTNPDSGVQAFVAPYQNHQYDESFKEGAVTDSLNIPSGLYFTEAQIAINTRPSSNGAPSMGNAIYAGKLYNNSNAYVSKDTNSPAIASVNGGKIHFINGYENLNSGGTLLTLLNSGLNNLDIAVAPYRSVDAIKLFLCAKKVDNPSDIAIDKNVSSISYSNGVATIVYNISFTGSLPANEPLVIEDIVPNGLTFININANGWNCMPNTPISSGNSLICQIIGPYNPIPSIEIRAIAKGETNATNCVEIVKGNGTYYNIDSENDKDCVDVEINAIAIPHSCNRNIAYMLSNKTKWKDDNGISPYVHNFFSNTQYPEIWDPLLTWFDFTLLNGTTHIYKIDFCTCGDTTVRIDNFKSDNYGKIYLDNDPNPTSYNDPSYIVFRDINSQATMASWAPAVSGYLSLPYTYNGTAINHTLYLNVKNSSLHSPSGAAIKGVLYFKGHFGKCTQADNN